jgi:hypothetical protein
MVPVSSESSFNFISFQIFKTNGFIFLYRRGGWGGGVKSVLYNSCMFESKDMNLSTGKQKELHTLS